MTIAFVDVETTGLDPDRHEMWELAVIVRGHSREDWNGEWCWQLPVDLSKADAGALRVGRYYERVSSPVGSEAWMLSVPPDAGTISDIGQLSRTPLPRGVAAVASRLLDGAVFVAGNPAFDSAFIQAFLRRHGHAGTWDYHLQDIGSMVRGWMAGKRDGWTSARQSFVEWHEYEVRGGRCVAAERAMISDTAALTVPDGPVRLDQVAGILGIDPIPDQERHTALGDARFLVRCWDAMGGAA